MAEVATDSYWLDYSPGATSRALGKDSLYVNRLQKKDPDMFQEILKLGRGQFIIGHIRYIEKINRYLFYFGELFHILNEYKFGLYAKWEKRKDFRLIYKHAWSSKEQTIPYGAYQSMKQFISEMIEFADKLGALEEYGIREEYMNVYRELKK